MMSTTPTEVESGIPLK